MTGIFFCFPDFLLCINKHNLIWINIIQIKLVCYLLSSYRKGLLFNTRYLIAVIPLQYLFHLTCPSVFSFRQEVKIFCAFWSSMRWTYRSLCFNIMRKVIAPKQKRVTIPAEKPRKQIRVSNARKMWPTLFWSDCGAYS